jgi:hypothetical protein
MSFAHSPLKHAGFGPDSILTHEMCLAVISCFPRRTSKAVAQGLLALDIYYGAIATPHRCSATRSETTAIMGCRTRGDEDAPTEVGIR